MMALLRDLLFGTPQRPAPAPRTPPGPPSEAQLAFGRQIYQFFVAQGLQPHQAAAIAGNMVHEGGGRADLVYSGRDGRGDNPTNAPLSPHSMGIAQWNDRAPNLIAFARSRGIEIPEGNLTDARHAQDVIRRIPLQTQLEFAWAEMQGPEGNAFRGIQSGTDLRSSVAAAIGYHRPRGWTPSNPEAGDAFDRRLTLADNILRAGPLPEGYTPPAPTPATTTGPQAPPATTTGGLLSGVLDGTPFAGLARTPDATQQQQQADPADHARRMADALVNPREAEGSGIRPVQLPQLDLTRLRALMQRRGALGTTGPMEG